jgi:hypothetical protein
LQDGSRRRAKQDNASIALFAAWVLALSSGLLLLTWTDSDVFASNKRTFVRCRVPHTTARAPFWLDQSAVIALCMARQRRHDAALLRGIIIMARTALFSGALSIATALAASGFGALQLRAVTSNGMRCAYRRNNAACCLIWFVASNQ